MSGGAPAAEAVAATLAARRTALAIGALVAGAVAMGISPVFVRTADVGPLASAFWRVTLALPLLLAWSRLEPRPSPAPAVRAGRAAFAAGLLFAGDLTFWHLAIVNTTIANATLLATLAPVWVALGSWALIGERVAGRTFAGLGLCLVGAALLVGASLSFAPQRLDGDACGLVTSLFFGGYILAVRAARRGIGAGTLMFRSSLVTALALLVAALTVEDRMLPHAAAGLASLVALAVLAHTLGQGLVALALGRLPAAFSALVIFLEALTAAISGWVLLGEALGPSQFAGGGAILAGIWLARPRQRSRLDTPPMR